MISQTTTNNKLQMPPTLRKRVTLDRSDSDVDDALRKRREEAYTHVEGDLHNEYLQRKNSKIESQYHQNL